MAQPVVLPRCMGVGLLPTLAAGGAAALFGFDTARVRRCWSAGVDSMVAHTLPAPPEAGG